MADSFKKYKEYFLHSFVWVIILVIVSLFIFSGMNNLSFSFLYKMAFFILVFYINYLFLVPSLLLKKRNFYYSISVLLLLLVSVFIFSRFFPTELIRKSPFVKGIPIYAQYLRIGLIFLIFLISSTMIRIFEEWNKIEKKKREIESQKITTELQFLKNQISPHFLFNSLNSIYSLTTKKSNDAPEAIITLSELMRYILYQTNNDFVLLKNELIYIENYLKLQRLRILNNENVTLNIHGNISNQKIRPLLLISFIENAFKHGTDFKGNTLVDIDIYVDKNTFKFTCINLIGSTKKDDKNSGIGFKNTKNRLELLYPKKYELLVVEEDNKFKLELMLKLD